MNDPLYPELEKLGFPHIGSFNNLFRNPNSNHPGLLNTALRNYSRKVEDSNGNMLTFRLCDLQLQKPSTTLKLEHQTPMYPSECRQSGTTYAGQLTSTLVMKLNNLPSLRRTINLGQLPIMLKSSRCNLQGLGPQQLMRRGEEGTEFGGYFVVNGNEKLIRLLIATKRNYPLSISRPSFKIKGIGFTEYGVLVRSVDEAEISKTNTLHYLTSGEIKYRFWLGKKEYLIPVVMILKVYWVYLCLVVFDVPDFGSGHIRLSDTE